MSILGYLTQTKPEIDVIHLRDGMQIRGGTLTLKRVGAGVLVLTQRNDEVGTTRRWVFDEDWLVGYEEVVADD